MSNRYYPIGDKELASVTTITGLADKSDALIPWAVNCAVDYISKRVQLDEYMASIGDTELTQILSDARTEWSTVRDEARDTGTEVHASLEAWLRTYLGKQLDDSHAGEFAPESELAKSLYYRSVEKIVTAGKVVKVLAVEQKVVNEDEWYAGRFDALLEVDGETWLIDFKTGGNDKNPGQFYDEWGMQLAAYAEGYEGGECQECYGSGGFGGADIISDPFDECLICNGTGTANGKRIDRIKVLRLDKKTLKAHWKEYGGEKDALTREWYYRAFLGLRDAFYILKAKKPAKLAFMEGHHG